MIQEFVDRFMAAKPEMLKRFKDKAPESYDSLFEDVVAVISDVDQYGSPDPERITAIDHGDYQGTRLFVVSGRSYQPSRYWAVAVSYGSCSGCDSFEAIRGYSDEPPTDTQINGWWTLCLHMVQGMKEIEG